MRNSSRTVRRIALALTLGVLVIGTGAGAVAPPRAPATAADAGVRAAAGDQDGPQFYSGVTVDVSGAVNGDVYAAGQSVTISGDVTGDVIAAAQTITITGTVDGNVRLSGQAVTISGEVSRSGTIFAADVTVTETGSFGDDLVGAAGDMRVAGTVGRDLMLSVGTLTIDGAVGGSLTYHSDREARIAEGAVAGTVQRIAPAESPRVEISPWAVVFGWFLGLLYALVAFSLVTLVAGLAFPRWLDRVTGHLLPSPWKALLVGFVAAITVPIVLLFLLVTVVGAPLALIGAVVWLAMTLAAFPYVAHYVGRLVFRDRRRPVVESLLGGLILIAALQVPWLNIVVWLAMVCFGLGAQLLEIHRQRPWAASRESAQERSERPGPTEDTSPASDS